MITPKARPAPLLDVFYPIVPDVGWLERIVPLGVRTIQLRLKDASPTEVRRQIAASLALTRAHGAQLIVNDYWQLAIEEEAEFIHLGQEDLAAADLKAIRGAGLKFGVSTHDESELETALKVQPDYIALGPVYETLLKKMKWAPQGLDRVAAWKARIGAIPLVAIGGITPQRAPGVAAAGADSIAVITDILTHISPNQRVQTWIDWAHRTRS